MVQLKTKDTFCLEQFVFNNFGNRCAACLLATLGFWPRVVFQYSIFTWKTFFILSCKEMENFCCPLANNGAK